MSNIIDWILDLFRDPVRAQEFINDPGRSMAAANVSNLTAAQVQSVAATVAPAAVLHGGGDPVFGLQQAVAETHGIAFAPQRQYDAFSGNDTLSNNDTLSHNDTRLLSPETNVSNHAGGDQQQGAVNLDFGDFTFGDKTTNTADHGGVVVGGDNTDSDILTDGSVKQGGSGNTANTGDIHSGSHSPILVGEGNHAEDNSQSSGGGDIIQDNNGPVVKTGDIDSSGGGAAGGDGGHGGGILTGGGGHGGNATGGSGGGVVINAPSDQSTHTGSGDVTTVDSHGGSISHVDASHDDNASNSHNDSSIHDSHDDLSTHDSHDATSHVDVHNNIDAGLF
jgi:hypothetical protein